ncbi:MAG: hypothetical protein V1822_01475 [Candidatus Micrarchaeota archaeon]
MQLRTKKGQPSVEALMVFAIAIVFIIPLVLIFYSSTSLRLETLNYMEAKAFAQKISDAAGEVWYAGKGSRKTILVDYPSSMTGIVLSGTGIPCPNYNGQIICDESIKYSGRDIILSFKTESGEKAQMDIVSPAPLKNNYGITGQYIYEQRLDSPVSIDGQISSGLTVLVIKNEGPYVNVVRYVDGANY